MPGSKFADMILGSYIIREPVSPSIIMGFLPGLLVIVNGAPIKEVCIDRITMRSRIKWDKIPSLNWMDDAFNSSF